MPKPSFISLLPYKRFVFVLSLECRFLDSAVASFDCHPRRSASRFPASPPPLPSKNCSNHGYTWAPPLRKAADPARRGQTPPTVVDLTIRQSLLTSPQQMDSPKPPSHMQLVNNLFPLFPFFSVPSSSVPKQFSGRCFALLWAIEL